MPSPHRGEGTLLQLLPVATPLLPRPRRHRSPTPSKVRSSRPLSCNLSGSSSPDPALLVFRSFSHARSTRARRPRGTGGQGKRSARLALFPRSNAPWEGSGKDDSLFVLERFATQDDRQKEGCSARSLVPRLEVEGQDPTDGSSPTPSLRSPSRLVVEYVPTPHLRTPHLPSPRHSDPRRKKLRRDFSSTLFKDGNRDPGLTGQDESRGSGDQHPFRPLKSTDYGPSPDGPPRDFQRRPGKGEAGRRTCQPPVTSRGAVDFCSLPPSARVDGGRRP